MISNGADATKLDQVAAADRPATNGSAAPNHASNGTPPRPAIEIAGARFEGTNQLADIGRRDLCDRRKPQAPAIAAPMLPRHRRRRGKRHGGKQGEKFSHGVPRLHAQGVNRAKLPCKGLSSVAQPSQ